MNTRTAILATSLSLVLLLLPPQGLWHNVSEKHFLGSIREVAPQTAVPASIASYENLLRQYAEGIDWDWRLLAAIVYHESRFNNDAQSSKGATGLMQIHSTRYSADTLLIPAVNLSIGTAYLKKLERMFDAAGPMDSLQFALAAFNLGDGKMRRLISRADSAGLDARRWEEVATMLPQGHHTVAYVDKVLNTFDEYSRKYPR